MEKPLVVEDMGDGQIPTSVKTLRKSCRDDGIVLTILDELVLILHVLMLEMSFFPVDNQDEIEGHEFNYNRVMKLSKRMPDRWKQKNDQYILVYVLKPASDYPCTLVMTRSSEDLLVNLHAANIDNVNFSIVLDSCAYIVPSLKCTIRYQYMKMLSYRFKSCIAYPTKANILQYCGITYPSIENLPVEVIMYLIQKHLDKRSILNLGKTCWTFWQICGCSKLRKSNS